MTRGRPLRPTSYVTRLPGRESWREILAKYRAGPPTLGAVPKPAPTKVRK